MWCDVDMLELLTEGTQEDREKAFKQMGDGLYRCLNSFGEEKRQCILIDKHLIENDIIWWNEQGKAKIDMELACKYQKVLEERFYDALLLIEQLDSKVTQFCEILRDREYPEFQHKKEDSEEIKDAKRKFRAEVFDDYCCKIREKIIENFREAGYEESFLKKPGQHGFWCQNMLYNCRKDDENKEKQKHITKVINCVNMALESGCKENNIEDEITASSISDDRRAQIKKKARNISCGFIFLSRDWDIKLWMELFFLKYYKEMNDKRPGLKTDMVKGGYDEESLKKRRSWIRKESTEWFVQKENRYTWQLTEEAVKNLVELESKEERMELLNYTIRVNLSTLTKINVIITHSDTPKKALDSEFGLKPGAFTRRLQQQTVKDMHPYVACLAWQESHVPFEELFQIIAINKTHKDEKVIQAYNEVSIPESLNDALALTSKHMEAKPDKRNFWYMPKRDARIARICIELSGPDQIKCIVEYASFKVEPLVINLPYSYGMENIANLKEEKMAELLELAEFETKEALIKYCAEMMVRNYCREYFGIPYEVFQQIKCYANVTITVYPLVFCKPDGRIQVGYAGYFKRNQMTRFGGDGYIEIYEDQVWQDREALEKDWQEVREKMGVFLKEEWLKDNAPKKYYSEYAMQQPDFFEYIYKEPYIVEESDAERIMRKIRSEDEIHV